MLNKIMMKMSQNKRNIVKISSGTLLGQMIAIITIPILTRIYGPNIIGIWSLLNSIATIVISFSDLGMTQSIMTEDEENISNTYSAISTIVALVSIISSIVITIYYSRINKFDINTLFIFFMITFMIFIPQQIQVCHTWLNRESKYNVLMKNPVIQYGITGIIAILLGILGVKKYGYYVANMIGYLFTLMHMKKYLPNKMFNINIKQIREIVIKNKKFVIFQTPSRILNNFLNQLPTLLIQGLWGTKVLGYYSITVRILQIPSALIASAIGRVFFQTISNLKRKGDSIGKYVYKNLIQGMKIGIIPMTFLMGFGDVIANIFLGVDWKTAGDFIRILSLQYYFMFLMNTVLGLEIVLEKQKYKMISSILQIFGFIIGAVIGKYIFENIYIGLIIMSSLYIIVQIGYFCTLFKAMEISAQKYLINVLMSIGIVIMCSFIIRYIFEYTGVISNIYDILDFY